MLLSKNCPRHVANGEISARVGTASARCWRNSLTWTFSTKKFFQIRMTASVSAAVQYPSVAIGCCVPSLPLERDDV